MNKETLKIVLAGHVDHGKSTLIGRLLLDTKSLPKGKLQDIKKVSKSFGRETELAYLSDQLKEERQRNMTIDTTEIFIKTPRRHYALIDTPGHLEFIKNMLTGAARAEAAILLIDAREGIREQTFRHAYLLKFLSIRDILVVVNKMDLLDYDRKSFYHVSTGIATLMASLGLEARHIIPVAAKKGDGIVKKSPRMPWYQGPSLLEAMAECRLPSVAHLTSLRLPVQDVLKMDGRSMILGRIASGALKQRQKVQIMPARAAAEVAAINVYPRSRREARRPENIALVLSPDVPARRGDIMVDANDTPALTSSFHGNIFWMGQDPLRRYDEVTLHVATQIIPARVQQISQKMDPANLQILESEARLLDHHQTALIRFEMDNPVVLETHADLPELGRYVLKKQEQILGIGTVLEKYP